MLSTSLNYREVQNPEKCTTLLQPELILFVRHGLKFHTTHHLHYMAVKRNHALLYYAPPSVYQKKNSFR